MPIRRLISPVPALKKKVKKAKQKFLDEVGKGLVKANNKTVENWKNRPNFTYKVNTRQFKVEVSVKDNDAGKIWGYVNFGTGSRAGGSAYEIRPKKAGGILAFNAGYSPKTTRKSFNRPASSSGPLVITTKVLHPGIEPRRLDLQAQKVALKKTSSIFKKLFIKVRL